VQIEPEQWSDLSRLLDEALDVPISRLDHWLNSLPSGDALHRSKLRELLKQRAAAETGDFLITLPKVTDRLAGRSLAVSGIVPGAVIGPYILEEEIGRGGMGAVWRARRSDGVIKRPLALKLPHAGPLSQELIERFTRERDILGELSHPNIARLDDAGVTAYGQPFLALEYVPGVPLTHYCDERGLDVRARLRLYMQVLRAVQHAHGHLVIHRDLKPSNVIVTPQGQAMLLDFGIAKLVPDDDHGRTQIGAIALTPEYASPEQIAGKPVSTASDIYSLGVLLFELLTGERPYRLSRTTRGALEEAILCSEPQRPSAVVQSAAAAMARGTSVKTLSHLLRGDLDTIVLKALKKSPAERYATADALSRDIEHYLRGEPVTARADGSWYRFRKLVGRHKLPVAAVTGALVALVATAALALVEAHIATAERDRALALSASNAAVTEFVNMLGVVGNYYHVIGQDEHGESLLRDALAAVRTSADPDLRRELSCLHAMSLAALGRVKEAVNALKAAIRDPGINVQSSANCLGSALEALGRYADAREAYSLCEPKAPGSLIAAMDQFCLLGIASVERELGNLAAADEYIARTAASISPAVPQKFPARITLRMMRAKVAISKGQFTAARTELDSVLADVRTDALVLSALLIRGELNLDENKLPAALDDARHALMLAQHARGEVPYSSPVGQASLLIARILARQGNAIQAKQAAQTAVDNLSRTVDAAHPWLKEARQLAS
jgi:serine/threonine protein kinase